MIWIHLAIALLALGLGTANLVLAKGTARHRVFGAVLTAAMLCLTVASFWTRDSNAGTLRWIPRPHRRDACQMESTAQICSTQI